MLIEKHDPESDTLRWSLPARERCYCDKVAMRITDIASFYDCPDSTHSKSEELWFTDNPIPFTQKWNWTPEKLDELFDRTDYCNGKCTNKAVTLCSKHFHGIQSMKLMYQFC